VVRLQRARQVTLQAVGEGTYLAPSGRRNELRAAFYPLLGAFSEPVWVSASKNRAIDLYLVSDVPPAQ
jgi:hypothetical protein